VHSCARAGQRVALSLGVPVGTLALAIW
jgi:hypothetical protein